MSLLRPRKWPKLGTNWRYVFITRSSRPNEKKSLEIEFDSARNGPTGSLPSQIFLSTCIRHRYRLISIMDLQNGQRRWRANMACCSLARVPGQGATNARLIYSAYSDGALRVYLRICKEG